MRFINCSAEIGFTLRIGVEDNDSSMQVDSYDNPVNALLDFKPNFYDLLLIDVNMPLMNGFELCEKLLQKDINVKVCFMTAGEINMDAAREVHPLEYRVFHQETNFYSCIGKTYQSGIRID